MKTRTLAGTLATITSSLRDHCRCGRRMFLPISLLGMLAISTGLLAPTGASTSPAARIEPGSEGRATASGAVALASQKTGMIPFAWPATMC
jgi:hypothetical protein